MLSGNVLAASTGCASSCVSQFKSKRSKANERISVWCFLGSDAAIYRVPVPSGRGIISLWIPRAVSGWRKKQIEECEMSLKQMQILDGAVAVKPEPVIDKSAAIRIATSLGWEPKRTWVGLTEQDLDYLCNLAYTGDEEFALAVQAKLMEKNT
jgi:hypothetical protein